MVQARKLLGDEPRANMVLLRGFAKHTLYPSMKDRYGSKALAIAAYPVYRGICRLVGMTVSFRGRQPGRGIEGAGRSFCRV